MRQLGVGLAALQLLLIAALQLQAATGRQIPLRRLQPEEWTRKLTSGYLSNADLTAYLNDYVKRCSSIAKLSSVGKSVSGTPMLALEISDTPGVDNARPQIKYVGNIHGDEPSGRQLLLLLAEKLCSEYKQVGSAAYKLVKTVRMTLVPTLNPDGFDLHKRENKNNIDLNRNFPDPIRNKGKDLKLPVGQEQAETLAMMNFTLSQRFVASLVVHEGALVANYPYDGYPDGSTQIKGTKNPAPDDSAFIHLAKTYARLHTTMHKSAEFADGITNGAQWYPLYGGMQDWNYMAANCLEVTLELNNDKWPTPERLAAMWTENMEALVQWPLKTVMAGLRGTVTSSVDGQPVPATISIVGIAHNTSASKQFGDYYRVLAPGDYKMVVTADGFQAASGPLRIPNDGTGAVKDWVLQSLAAPTTTKKVEIPASPLPPATKAVPADVSVATKGDDEPDSQPDAGDDAPDAVSPPLATHEEDDWVVVGEGSKQSKTWHAGMSNTAMVSLFLVPVVLGGGYYAWRRRAGGGGGGWSYTQLTATSFPRPPATGRAKTMEP